MTLLAAALLVAAAYGLGLAVSRGLDRLDWGGDVVAGSAVEAPIVLGLGAWALGVVALLLGLVGGLRPAPLALVLALAALPALAGRHRRRPLTVPRLGPMEWTALALLAAVAAGNLVRALAPPTAWDAIAYQLALARHFAEAGSFIDLPTIRPARWPLGVVSLYTLAESLGGAPLSGLVAWLLGLLALVATALLAARLEGAKASLLAAALLAASPVVAFLGGVAYVDLALAAFVALALAALLRHQAGGRRSDLARAGLLAGAAATVKYTGLAYPLLAALALAVLGRRLRPPLIVLGFAALAAAPWYARTAALTGNPLWPYAHRFFGGADWDEDHAMRLSAFERGYGAGTAPGDLLLAPWRVTFEDARFGELMLGPLFLALAPLALVRAARPRAVLAGFVATGFVAWFLVTQQSRFLVPLLPALAAAVAAGAYAKGSRIAGGVARALVLAGLASTLLLVLPAARERLPVVLGREPEEAFLARSLSSYRAMRFVDQQLRPARLLLFREVRAYYLKTPYLWGDPLNQARIDYRRLADAAALRRRLAELGVDAVLVNDREYPPSPGYYDRRTLELMEEMLARWGERVWAEGGVRVYRLRPPS